MGEGHEQMSRYVTWCLGTVLLAVLLVASVNYVVDPFQYYRPTRFGHIRHFKYSRYQNPGLVKHYDFDTVLIGSSFIANMLPGQFRELFGWHALNLTLAGPSALEECLTLQKALATGKVKRVLWCIDKFTFYGPQYRQDIDSTLLPAYLYEPDLLTHPRYLISIGTLGFSVRILRGKGVKDLDQVYTWHHRADYGPERVWDSWRHQLKTWAEIERRRYEKGDYEIELMNPNFDRCVAEPIRDNPDVEFCLFFPPMSILYYMFEQNIAPDMFEIHQQFRQHVMETVLAFENCSLYDFQAVKRYTHNYDYYWDYAHYSKALSDYTIASIKAGRHRVTEGNCADLNRELRTQFDEYYARMPQEMMALPESERQWPPFRKQ